MATKRVELTFTNMLGKRHTLVTLKSLEQAKEVLKNKYANRDCRAVINESFYDSEVIHRHYLDKEGRFDFFVLNRPKQDAV